ncbi:60S ribosomal protein L28-like [Hydractinia symbiolongicarpus]|uniref:60S ribosomal protein L28-like n=1 Tax=Hydractinia symbiolongicarpus TaxID=13093 RepID=UPI00254A6CC8|nr:60S ribosomal protein L28-like [Hydractinia symbiolongicarpus]XP_057292302.1 60S ribosomal protein L28-like [Hydractinia symbiolongicarpus]
MSAELCWSIVRKNSCYLVKSLGKTLTKEPNNVTKINAFKYNGYVNRKSVGVDAAPGGKGVVLTLKKTKGQNRPLKALSKSTIQGSRHAIKTIKNTLAANGYRKDLTDPAIRRACAIIRSQNTAVVKKRRSRRKKN